MIKINNIKATNVELTEAISGYVSKKVDMLEKYVDPNDTSVSVDVELVKTTDHHQKGEVFRAEANFGVGGKMLRAEATNEDMYASIDEMKDELARVLSEKKKKDRTQERKGGSFIKNMLRGFRK